MTHTKENPFEFRLQAVKENDGYGGEYLQYFSAQAIEI